MAFSHDGVAKKGSVTYCGKDQTHCPAFVIFGALLFPLLNNMKAFVGKAENNRLPDQAQRGKTPTAVDTEHKVPNDLGGAAREGNLEKIREFLKQGAEVNGKYDKDFTPLHWAATMNQVEAIELLIDEGANLDSRDGHQSTPLLLAAFFGQTKSVEVLLQRGADPNLGIRMALFASNDGRRAVTEWVARIF